MPQGNCPATQQPSFYKRALPDVCVDFSSVRGKALFRQALEENNMESYFKLASQFTTQSEPAFCGLGTLCMVLNALEVDPQRQWKGPWRWYDDTMLDCCRPLEEIKRTGITLGEFSCLAKCNGLNAKTHRPDQVSIEKFRRDLKRTSSVPNQMLCVSFDRGTLQQTGAGHFSPVAGYSAKDDMVLILDVARFKYPPYWVASELLWSALKPVDPDTKKSRGYIMLKRNVAVVSDAALSQLSVNKSTFPTLWRMLSVEFPRMLEHTPPATAEATIACLINAVPQEYRSICEQRQMTDRATAVVLPPAPLTMTTTTISENPIANGAAPANGRASIQRQESLDSFQDAYDEQLAQLVHLIHETKLCKYVVKATRRGMVRRRSSAALIRASSLSALGLPSAVADVSEPAITSIDDPETPRHTHTHFITPSPSRQASVDSVAHACSESCSLSEPTLSELASSSSSFGIPASSSRSTDNTDAALVKAPAFLTMFLLAMPLDTLVPAQLALPADLRAKLERLWDIDNKPLLLKNEIALLRQQLGALQKWAMDENHCAAAAAPQAAPGLFASNMH
ncbi:hypothetical protein RI367_006540 [Sorochytrium milnesiophthora]